MKKIILFYAVFAFSVSFLVSADKKRDEFIVMPDVTLIDIPTAGVVDYYGFHFKTRFYNNGGVLTYLNFGIMDRLNLGASFMVDRLIGAESPVKMVKPEMQLKFRVYDGSYYIPAISIGYDGQGYYYDTNLKKYMQKGKGLYVVGSRESFAPNLFTHLGLNVPDFDDGYVYAFLGLNYNLDDKLNFLLEYDNLFHSDYPERLNAGLRININTNFLLDVAFRNIGENSTFQNGQKNRMERIIQFTYITSF